MKAIILAAGIGRRMQPLTNAVHKTLLKINGRTIIEGIMDNLINNGISDVIIATGYRSAELKEFVSAHYANINVSYVHNERFAETNNIHSLALVFDSVKISDDILLIESDLIFEEKVIQRIINSPYANVALLDHFKSGMDGTVVTVSEQVVTGIIPPHLQGAGFDFSDKYKTLNIYKFSKDFCNTTFKQLLTYYSQTIDDNCYYELILGILIYIQKETIYAEIINTELWAEIDDPNDLRVAEFIFDKTKRLESLDAAQGGCWNNDMLDFCFIRNMYFPNNSIFSELKNSLVKLCQNYGSSQKILNKKLEFYLGIQPGKVNLLNGLSQVYPILSLLWGDKKFLMPEPTFGEYKRLFKNSIFYADRVDIDLAYIQQRAKDCAVVVFVNPNNPTGSAIDSSAIIAFAAQARDKIIIVDESFIDFSRFSSLIPLLEESALENVIVLKSLSKSLGIPGLRLGFVYSCNDQYNRLIREALPIWNINSVAEHFLEIILKHKNSIEMSFAKTIKDREIFLSALNKLTFVKKAYNSQANFILVEFKDDAKLKGLVASLLSEYSIYVKDVSPKFNDGKFYLRFAVRLPQENQRLIECLSACLLKG